MSSGIEKIADPIDPEVERAATAVAAVPDPEIPVVTIAELGMLRGIARAPDGAIRVALTPTYTGCPATSAIRLAVEAALLAAGVGAFRVDLVLTPPWTTDDITEDGRRKLSAFGIAPPAKGSSRGRLLFAEEKVSCPRCASTDTVRVSEFGSTPCKAHWRCRACREPFDYFKCL